MDKLASVRNKFILSLKDKATELEAELKRAVGSDSLDNLRAIVHKIAGSAGFYGQSDIAELAMEIDGKLQALKNVTLSEQIELEIGELVALMRRA